MRLQASTLALELWQASGVWPRRKSAEVIDTVGEVQGACRALGAGKSPRPSGTVGWQRPPYALVLSIRPRR